MNDSLLRPALEAFFDEQRKNYLDQLLTATQRRKTVSDTWRESVLAGRAAAYEFALSDLDTFAKEQMEKASQ